MGDGRGGLEWEGVRTRIRVSSFHICSQSMIDVRSRPSELRSLDQGGSIGPLVSIRAFFFFFWTCG